MSIISAEMSTRRMTARVNGQRYSKVVSASEFGGPGFVDFLAEQAGNPFLAKKIYEELSGLISQGRRLDTTLWQVLKMARATMNRSETQLNELGLFA